MTTNIWWIRRDLRLHDNPALTSARQQGARVVPVFILDDYLLEKPAEYRKRFLFAGLRALDNELRSRGGRLIIRRGEPARELARLAAECGATQVYAEADVSPYAIRRDADVARQVDLKLVHGLSVHPTPSVMKEDGQPYTVFTPYSRAWKAIPARRALLPAPTELPAIPNLASCDLPDLGGLEGFPAGELEAQRRLDDFIRDRIDRYGIQRNRVDLDGTAGLSPYLRFGMVSASQVVAAAQQAADNAPDAPSRASSESWLNELIWREFYQSILYHYPHVLKAPFKASMSHIPWRDAPQELLAWKEGRTGYPIVDAGMRQLAATGWMHNRARMIVASFLVKDLLINWQEGERWFMEKLVDGDPAANNGGWQWVAGTGTDAAPYFRIFNPVLQGKKFDPNGDYVRRWVPELAQVPAQHIHSPWEMTAAEQQEATVRIGRDYPSPIVDHAFARERTLKAYAMYR